MAINFENCWEKLREKFPELPWPVSNKDRECDFRLCGSKRLCLKIGVRKKRGITCKVQILQGSKAKDTLSLVQGDPLPTSLSIFTGVNEKIDRDLNNDSVKYIGFLDEECGSESFVPFGEDDTVKQELKTRIDMLTCFIQHFVDANENIISRNNENPNIPDTKAENELNNREIRKMVKTYIPIKYPITIKINIKCLEHVIPDEIHGLDRLNWFGDIQCRYKTDDGEEVLCFVFQKIDECPYGQCIFGIKKNILLQKCDSDLYFRLDDNQGNGEIIEKPSDEILEALPLTYGMTSSWAVGPKTKSGLPVKALKGNYSKILYDWIQYTKFTESVVDNDNKLVDIKECRPASIDDFNPSIVFLGQNWSDTILDVCHNNMQELCDAYWQNFQPGNAANKKSGLLRDAIEGTILEKAYMTDFDKGNIETESNKAFQKSRERKKINASILSNELQDLTYLTRASSDISRNVIICVWGTGQWDNVPNDIKYGKKEFWRKYEFRLIGEHYSSQNGPKKQREQAVADFSASLTWQQALFNVYVEKYGIEEKHKMELRHLCYISGVIIQSEIYREPNAESGFGGVGRKFGNEAVKRLYDETQQQVLALGYKFPELPRLTEKIKIEINNDVKKCLFEPIISLRGKKAYDILIKKEASIPETLSMFLNKLADLIKDMMHSLGQTN